MILRLGGSKERLTLTYMYAWQMFMRRLVQLADGDRLLGGCAVAGDDLELNEFCK